MLRIEFKLGNKIMEEKNYCKIMSERCEKRDGRLSEDHCEKGGMKTWRKKKLGTLRKTKFKPERIRKKNGHGKKEEM